MVVYSLGNLVCPGPGPNEGFRQAVLLRLEFGAHGRLVDWKVLPEDNPVRP